MIQSAIRLLPRLAPLVASMCLAVGVANAAPVQGGGAGWEESGQASWYGGYHNGRRTSSGRIFNDREMTAAHATLPLGSKIRVTMQDTGESVLVTVTDRQPYKQFRVIDLSRGAAERIGLVRRGTGIVTLATARVGETDEVSETPVAVNEVSNVSDDAPRPRGRPRMRRVAQAGGAHPPCCRAPSVVQVRRSVPRQSAPRTL